MGARMHRPAPPLDGLVDCLWAWESYTAPAPRERALPSGTVDIVINLRDDCLRASAAPDRPFEAFPGILISGAHPGYFVIDTPPCASVMGVHFRPGGAAPFLGVPADELAGRHAALADVWGPAATALRERLLAAPDWSQRFALLERFLLARATRPLARDPAVAAALRAFEDPRLRSVAEVGALTGLSPKRLLALFRGEVGLGPKAYWRVRRFQAALRRIEGGPVRKAELAAELGYCDQAHFNREFRELCGLSPREYLAQGVERDNHVPLRG